jgi:post-segregation antitoxin (ccd killing protein)
MIVYCEYSCLMSEEQKSDKLRLNITVDKKTVELAKDMGFNISATLEEYLKVLTYMPQKESYELVAAYNAFFHKLQPILDRYDTSIEIGEVPKSNRPLEEGDIDWSGCKLFLDNHAVTTLRDGKYYVDTWQGGGSIKDLLFGPYDDIHFFYHPRKIIRNLVSEVKKVAANNNIKVQKLNLAMKFVDALFNDLENSSESGSETPLLRRIREDVEAEEKMRVSANYASNSHEERKETIVAV